MKRDLGSNSRWTYLELSTPFWSYLVLPFIFKLILPIYYRKKSIEELGFEIEQSSEELAHGALEGDVVSFIRYSDFRESNLNMNLLQTAGIEEVFSTRGCKFQKYLASEWKNWLYFTQVYESNTLKWSYGKFDDTTKILVRYVIS